MDIRFASLCDAVEQRFAPDPYGGTKAGICGERSSEYTRWPSCRVCNADVCLRHQSHGSFRDDDGRLSVVCVACALEELG